MIEVEYRHRIRVVHEYTPKVSPTKWGETVIKYNNEQEIDSDFFNADSSDFNVVQSYLDIYGDRITKEPVKHEWDGKFEGIYGYIWNDIRIEIVTERIEITTTRILGE